MSKVPDSPEQLVRDVCRADGVEPPRVLHGDSAALLPGVSAGDAPPYLIGVIGGKDVGKTSLVNAIAGTELSAPIGHGRGTDRVIAYAHGRAAPMVRELLTAEAPDAHRIETHRHDDLLRQVLVDLPDVDSRYAEHVALTRRMLRHMLFPVWVQSVEKYADAAPAKLLAAVAEGNDPANFVFVLNKADQIIDREGRPAADELAADYAERLRKLLNLDAPPRVHLVAANRPDDYDLPALRQTLTKQKSAQEVKQAKSLAERRRAASLIAWLRQQDLPGKAERAGRLRDEAAAQLAGEVAEPLLDDALPAMLADPAVRAHLAEPAVRRRVRRWPVVSLIDVALTPLIALVRQNLGQTGGVATPDAYLERTGRGVAGRVRSVFARLRQTDPEIGRLYEHQRLWTSTESDAAAGRLRQRLRAALDAQREQVDARPGRGRLLAPLRWLLTLGAAVWLAVLQPVAEVALRAANPADLTEWREVAVIAVEVLSAQHLLAAAGFLGVYFAVLWALLRTWHQNRTLRRLAGGRDTGLSSAVVAWTDALLAPVQQRAQDAEQLSKRLDALTR